MKAPVGQNAKISTWLIVVNRFHSWNHRHKLIGGSMGD